MLADELDYVIGVDPHRDTHAFAVVDVRSGGVVFEATAVADGEGYESVLRLANQHAPGRRAFAVEGTGSFGDTPQDPLITAPQGSARSAPWRTAEGARPVSRSRTGPHVIRRTRSVGVEHPDEEDCGCHGRAADNRCRRPASARQAGGGEHGDRGEQSDRSRQRKSACQGSKRPGFNDRVRREPVAQLSCLVDNEKADGEERHVPEGKPTAMHRDDELRREESHRRRQQQRGKDQSLERGYARRERQHALQRWECALDEYGQAG